MLQDVRQRTAQEASDGEGEVNFVTSPHNTQLHRTSLYSTQQHNNTTTQTKGKRVKTYLATIEGASPYTASRQHGAEKLSRERPDDYEARTWRRKLSFDNAGNAVIRATAFWNCLCDAAKYLGMQIPGKAKSTFTKKFEAGLTVESDLSLGITLADVEADEAAQAAINKGDLEDRKLAQHKFKVEGIWVSVNADGVRGSGKRVLRCFPIMRQWGGALIVTVLDEIITGEVLKDHIIAAGRYVGVGQHRPQNRGVNGRFGLVKIVEK